MLMEEKVKKRFIAIAFALVILLSVMLPSYALASDGGSQDLGSTSGTVVDLDKGPVFYSVFHTLAQGGPVKDNLIARGLFTFPKPDSKGGMIPGQINIGEIEKLVNSGAFHISEINTLELGPQTSTIILTEPVRKRAQILTGWLWDEFSYQGHLSYVDIPSYLPLNPGTEFNFYVNHLTETYGRPYFIESGVGRANWSSDPIIYTYTGYVGMYNWLPIPNGVARTVTLTLEIPPTGYATMFVSDPYSGYYISTFQQVYSINQRADQGQEEASYVNTWTGTTAVLQHDNYLKNSSGQWINWSDSIHTRYSADSKMYYNYGSQNNRKWINTWCTP
jgi:hypothetical protein